MRLDEGWNQIQFNLSDFTRRAYGTNYIETLRYINLILINIEYKYMPTVELEEYTSQIVFTVKKNYPPSLNSSFPYKNKLEETIT